MEQASAKATVGGITPGPLVRRHMVGAGVLAVAASALMVAVYLGLMIGFDTAVASAAAPPPLVDRVFPLVATLWSPEASLLMGGAGLLVLLRMRAGPWSTAALGFLLLVPLEIVVKLSIERPDMPNLLKPWPGYAVVSFPATDAVVNGSPMRTAFVCLLWALVLWDRGSAPERLVAVAAVLVNLISMVARIYGQYHWFSGELAGELLGAALALALAPYVTARLRKTRGAGTPSP